MKNKFSVAVVLVLFTSTIFSTSVNASEVQVERDIAATIDSSGVSTSMQSQYVSLSAALATMYASSKGLTLNNFLMTEPTMAASLLGTDPSLVRNKLSSNTAKELNSLLAKNQLTLSKDSYKSMESYANTLIKNSFVNV